MPGSVLPPSARSLLLWTTRPVIAPFEEAVDETLESPRPVAWPHADRASAATSASASVVAKRTCIPVSRAERPKSSPAGAAGDHDHTAAVDLVLRYLVVTEGAVDLEPDRRQHAHELDQRVCARRKRHLDPLARRLDQRPPRGHPGREGIERALLEQHAAVAELVPRTGLDAAEDGVPVDGPEHQRPAGPNRPARPVGHP